MLTRPTALLALLLATGCSAAADSPRMVVAAPAPLQIWAHNPELEAPARDAARRILASTGLIVEVNALGTSATAAPLFLSEQHGKWIGYCAPGAAWLAIDADLVQRPADLAETVLHEILHALGASHLPDGVVGVMAPDVQGAGTPALLTADDLVDVCSASAAACTAFVPEAP